MPIVTVPFLFLGLLAKVTNNRYVRKIEQDMVHSNKESQLYSLVEIITCNINNEALGSLHKHDFFTSHQEAAVTVKNR